MFPGALSLSKGAVRGSDSFFIAMSKTSSQPWQFFPFDGVSFRADPSGFKSYVGQDTAGRQAVYYRRLSL